MTSEVFIPLGLIATIAAVGSVAARLGLRLKLPLFYILALVSCAWGALSVAAVTVPSLSRIAAGALSFETSLDTTSQIAALILLFYAGLRTPKSTDQKGGRCEVLTGIAAAALALVLGSVIGVHFKFDWQRSSLLTALAMAPSFAMAGMNDERSLHIASVTGPIKRFTQTLAGVILVFILILSTFGTDSVEPLGARSRIVPTVLLMKTALFFVFAWVLGSRYAKRFAKGPKMELNIRLLVGFVLLLILLYVYASQFLGHLASLTWAFLAGVLFARTEFRNAVFPGLERLTHLICLPLLFISAGLKVQSISWNAGLVLIVIVAIAGRVLGTSLGVKGPSLKGRESLAVGLMAIPQAEVGVVLASYAIGRGMVGGSEYSAVILAAVGTTLLGSLLARPHRSSSAGVLADPEPKAANVSLT